jgi:lysine-specific histone demethylase 1
VSHGSTYPVVITLVSGEQIECDYVVCTIPLGVLKARTIEWTPALPAWKLEAIDRLGMGLLNKIVLIFNRCFWPKNMQWLEYVPPIAEKQLQIPYFQNYTGFYTEPPVLVAFLAADAAEQFETMSDAALTELCLSTLAKKYNATIVRSSFVKSIITRWRADPFSRGSYSYLRTGSRGGIDMDHVQRPVLPHLHFAGEHTNRRYPGTVHGAYDSGRKTAHSLKKLIQKQWTGIQFF